MNISNNGVSVNVKLEPLNAKSERKLLNDGFYYKVLEVNSEVVVTRLKEVDGYKLKLKSLSTPVTRWVALEGDPDFAINETGV